MGTNVFRVEKIVKKGTTNQDYCSCSAKLPRLRNLIALIPNFAFSPKLSKAEILASSYSQSFAHEPDEDKLTTLWGEVSTSSMQSGRAE